MPLLRTAMYAKGIELYCAITVDDRDTWLPTITHIALEGRCSVSRRHVSSFGVATCRPVIPRTVSL